MPVKFMFVDKSTHKPKTLNEIDEEMCKECNIPCDPKHFCNMFQICQMVGTSSKVQDESGNVDPEKLDQLLSTGNFGLSEHEHSLLKKYLVEKYHFTSWWQVH